MVSLIYILSTIVDLFFAAHKLETLSSSPGKKHIEYLLHLLIYIRDNKNLGLRYYAKIKDAPISNLLVKAIIKT